MVSRSSGEIRGNWQQAVDPGSCVGHSEAVNRGFISVAFTLSVNKCPAPHSTAQHSTNQLTFKPHTRLSQKQLDVKEQLSGLSNARVEKEGLKYHAKLARTLVADG